jgi:PQQ-dependent dehydrogenase (methanol/ethanol family)
MPLRWKTLLLALMASATALAAPVDQQRLRSAAEDSANWLTHGRDWQESRFSPLAQINTGNVGELGLAWYADLPDTRGLQATPLVADGVMYMTGNWNVTRAFDAATGTLLWEYDPGVDRKRAKLFCCGVVNRGVALWDDMVILGTLDGFLVAVDRATGDERWRTLTIDQSKNYSITGAPRVIADGIVVIGNGGSEYGVRGYVSGYDAQTGQQLWRFYTVPGNPADGFETPQMEQAAASWTGQWWTMGGGGTVWDSLAYDPELDLLYVGVGNGAPHNREMRSPEGGDNLFVASVMALRPRTGEYVWHHQQVPGESWDYTSTQQMVLAEISWQGRERKVLMQAPKNGFFFIYDRATGELLSAEPFAPVNWASHYDLDTGRPVETPGARYEDAPFRLVPSGIGAHNWHSMAWHPGTGLMYIPTQVNSQPMEREETFDWYEGHWNLGYKVPVSPINNMITRAVMKRMMSSHLLAWDPVAQREAWRAPTPWMGNGGVVATAGDLVFQGQVDNLFRAYDAESGAPLWQFDAQQGIMAAPISYAVDGVQYISVLAGRGGGLSMALGLGAERESHQRRLLTFKLGGKALLPAIEVLPDQREAPPAYDESSVERGGELYARFCLRCHGPMAIADGSVPDLRRLENHWYDSFDDVVLSGRMQGMGMPRFDDVLTEPDAAAVKSYVLSKAHEDWANHRSSAWWLAIKQWWAELVAWVIVALM